MRRVKKGMQPAGIGILFAAACTLLLGSSIGGARAALTYYSDTYTSRVQMFDIGVTLQENGAPVAWRDYNSAANGTWDEQEGMLLQDLLQGEEALKIGKVYPEELKVRNSGTINQYVRVSIYRYWTDAEGTRRTDLSPELIDLNLINLETDWILDEEASTKERTVLYYRRLLSAQDETGQSVSETVPFADTLTIDKKILTKVTQDKKVNGSYTNITTTYDYDDMQFHLEVQTDAVQEHNAEDAIWSAWGRRMNVHDGVLSLAE